MGAVGVRTFQRAKLTQYPGVEMAHKELVLLVVLGLAARGLSTSPLQCFGCPIDCGAPPFGCTYGIVPDFCGCCDECARGPGEICGGESGVCGHNDRGRLHCFNGECKWEWTPKINSCIIGNNNLVLDDVFSLDDCKSRCQDQIGFTRRSVEYNSWGNRCSLSEATSQSPSYSWTCPSGWVYTQIFAKSTPPPPPPPPPPPAAPVVGSRPIAAAVAPDPESADAP